MLQLVFYENGNYKYKDVAPPKATPVLNNEFEAYEKKQETALAGDTTTISTAQARDITSGALIDAKLNVTKVQANLSKSTAITFGEFTTTVVGKTTTYSLPITVVETDTSGKSTVTTTKTGSITLT